MELTLKDVHTYSFLVKEGRAEELYLPGMDESENSKLVVPKIDGDSKVYFYDISSKTKVYPGVDMIKKIKDAVDKAINPWYLLYNWFLNKKDKRIYLLNI